MGPKGRLRGWVGLVLVAGLCVSCVKIVGKPLLAPAVALHPADAIVVLGFGPPVDESGKPVDELRWRVEKGVALYQAGLAPIVVMTGGKTYQDFYEATVMKELAVSLGVPAGAVLEEREAMNTIDNARFTARLLKARGAKRIILVSNPYHLSRAVRLYRANGFEIQTAPYDHELKGREAAAIIMHEYMARIGYWGIDEEALARDE